MADAPQKRGFNATFLPEYVSVGLNPPSRRTYCKALNFDPNEPGQAFREVCSAPQILRPHATVLTALEKGYVAPKPGEIERISQTLDRLIAAKARIDQVAAEVGWPTGAAA